MEKDELKEFLITANLNYWSQLTESRNLFLKEWCRITNIDLPQTIAYILNALEMDFSIRNSECLLLEPYSTEKDFDRLLHSINDKYPLVIDENKKLFDFFVDKDISFDSFLISIRMNPELNQLFNNLRVSVNLYTQFIFNEILKKDRDYSSNILSAFRAGSDPKLVTILENINNGDNRTSIENDQILELYSIPYLPEFYAYMHEHVFNSAKEFMHDLANPPQNLSPAEYLETLAWELINGCQLRIDNQLYNILAVEGFYHPSFYLLDEYYPACVWKIEEEGVYITFSNLRFGIAGRLLLCKMLETTSVNEFIYNNPQNIKARFIEALQKGTPCGDKCTNKS